MTRGQSIPISHKVVAESCATEEDLDMMQIYKAVIAARNNVTGARNGPSVEMRGIYNIMLALSQAPQSFLTCIEKNGEPGYKSYMHACILNSSVMNI